MLRVDQSIKEIDENISKSLHKINIDERGYYSQNILSELRHLVEHIMKKIYFNGKDLDPDDPTNVYKSVKYCKEHYKYCFLYKFHSLLQEAVSHYMRGENASERLMLKYIDYLYDIRMFMHDNFNVDILCNLDNFPMKDDKLLMEYYAKISDKIIEHKDDSKTKFGNNIYYITKIKQFYVRNKIWYEITFTKALDNVSKFDRVIAFTDIKMMDNYAVQFDIVDDKISVLEREMPIKIIKAWKVRIKTNELRNLSRIFGKRTEITYGTKSYIELSKFLTTNRITLTDLLDISDEEYADIKSMCTKDTQGSSLFEILDLSRIINQNQNNGYNVIRYLLFKIRNVVIKDQIYGYKNTNISNLYLKNGCLQFDRMPYARSLVGHNPRFIDLCQCIAKDKRDHEILQRIIKNNTQERGILFTPIEQLSGIENLETKVNLYNILDYRYKNQIKCYKGKFLYMNEYLQDCLSIIKSIKNLTKKGVVGYSASVQSWIENLSYEIDSPEKKDILFKLFDKSRVALIYGSAGTGKTTMINYVADLFKLSKILCLANTNSAVNNLKQKINVVNAQFKTITSAINSKTMEKYDILVVDECSTVSNKDMRLILDRIDFKLLLLVGDIYQIESITFGNWFELIPKIGLKNITYDLTETYRSKNRNILGIWKHVREMKSDILERLISARITSNFDSTIFDYHLNEDEIILALNYDGLYGINNINKFLQYSNPNPEFKLDINTFKVGDPILFNESNRFAPLIYNNMKGTIVNIADNEDYMIFDVQLEIAVNEINAEDYDFEIIDTDINNHSIIRFEVSKKMNPDDDIVDKSLPFQIAYAISIHKAQGLEFNSVKIIIADELDEQISHNIFYTAITRTRDKLKIYWTPESEKNILESIELKKTNIDDSIIKELIKKQRI